MLHDEAKSEAAHRSSDTDRALPDDRCSCAGDGTSDEGDAALL